MTRRTMQHALTLIAVAGLAGPAMAQDATKDAPARERVRQQREGAPPVDEAAGRQARERQMSDEDMMERRREALDRAVENGRMTREEADAMLERMSQRTADGDEPMDREAMRGRFGGEALPAQINKIANLNADQHAKVNGLIRELRLKQMEALRELRGGPAAGRTGGPEGDAARGPRGAGDDDDARPQRGAPGEGERPRRGADGDDARPARGGAGDARPQRGAPGEGGRPARGAAAGETDDAGGALRGPRVPRQGGPEGGDDAMGDAVRGGPGGPGGWGQMSEEERHAFLREAREKLMPINRQFGKDLAEVLDEGQRKAVREKWETLSVMPPMIERLVEAEKAAKKAKDDEAKKGKDGKGKDAKAESTKGDDAEGDDDGDRPAARGKKAEPRQQGKRGGRGGGDDD